MEQGERERGPGQAIDKGASDIRLEKYEESQEQKGLEREKGSERENEQNNTNNNTEAATTEHEVEKEIFDTSINQSTYCKISSDDGIYMRNIVKNTDG